MSKRCKDCVHYCIQNGEPSCLSVTRKYIKKGIYFAPMPLRKAVVTQFNKCKDYEGRK